MSKDISLTQRDRRGILRKVIRDNIDNGHRGAPEEVIVNIITEEFGLDRGEIIYDLNKLCCEGYICQLEYSEYRSMS